MSAALKVPVAAVSPSAQPTSSSPAITPRGGPTTAVSAQPSTTNNNVNSPSLGPSAPPSHIKNSGGGTTAAAAAAGIDSGAVDPVLLAVWGCGGIPCQASLHDRIAGKVYRQPVGGGGGDDGGGGDASSASSCFVAVPRQGFLFAATKAIAEHYYPSSNGSIPDSGPSTRLWYSVEIPQTVTFEPLSGTEGSGGGRRGGGGGGNGGRLSMRLPTGVSMGRSGGGSTHLVASTRGGGGGVGGGASAASSQSLKVSATTPFGVVLDQLRVLLEDAVMTSPIFHSLPHAYRANGIRAFVDLPVRITLNIDDAPPADLLTIGATTYDRDAAMMLRQTQKEATATMFAGSVGPLLLIEPTVLDNLRYAGSSKSLDPVPFLNAKREIITRGMAVLSKQHTGGGSSNTHAGGKAPSSYAREGDEAAAGGPSQPASTTNKDAPMTRQGTSATTLGGRQNSSDNSNDMGGSHQQYPLMIRFHIVTPNNAVVRDLTTEALAKAAAKAHQLHHTNVSSTRPVEDDANPSTESPTGGVDEAPIVLDPNTGLYRMQPATTGASDPSSAASMSPPPGLIGSISTFLAAESTTQSGVGDGMTPIATTISRRILPTYTILDSHVVDVADASMATGSPLLSQSASATTSAATQQLSGIFTGTAFEVATRNRALLRLGDVLRAFIVPFASLTDEEIASDAPLPPRFGWGGPASNHFGASTKVVLFGGVGASPHPAPPAASSVRPRVLVFGVEPSLCVPIAALHSSMSSMDLALHITIDFTGCDNRYVVPPQPSASGNLLFNPNPSDGASGSSSSSPMAGAWQTLTNTKFTRHAQSLLVSATSSINNNSKSSDGPMGMVCACCRQQQLLDAPTNGAWQASVIACTKDAKLMVCFDTLDTTTTAPDGGEATAIEHHQEHVARRCLNPVCVHGLPPSALGALPPIPAGLINNKKDALVIPPPRYLPFVDEEGSVIRRQPLFVVVLPAAKSAWLLREVALQETILAAAAHLAEIRHSSGGGGVLPPRRQRGVQLTVSTSASPNKKNSSSSPLQGDDSFVNVDM